MAKREDHCADCLNSELQDDFDYVHEYLDRFFASLGPKHRELLHHKDGVEEIRAKFGDRAARAAEIHILRDWSWHPHFTGEVPTREEAELWTLWLF